MIRLCFVCLGNICRSPTAEGVMLALVQREGLSQHFSIESAGTASYHVGERPDRRTLATARTHGVELPSRARQWLATDFAKFDLVLAMDSNNRADLLGLAPDALARDKVLLLRSFEPDAELDAAVPDPYYGGPAGFEEVFAICERACLGLLASLRREYRL
jgi:protein-tyrosine phosphatase